MNKRELAQFIEGIETKLAERWLGNKEADVYRSLLELAITCQYKIK
jgi:hypothetical protein